MTAKTIQQIYNWLNENNYELMPETPIEGNQNTLPLKNDKLLTYEYKNGKYKFEIK